MTETLQEPPAPARDRAPLWEDFVDIYLAPRQVFERRREGRYIGALAVLTIAMALLNVPLQAALSSTMAAELRRGMAASGGDIQLDPATLERMQSISVMVGSLGALVMIPLAVLVIGAVIWGTASVLDLAIPFAAAAMISTYAAFPGIALTLSGILQGTLFDPDSLNRLSIGPARFLDPVTTSPILIAALSRLDLFTLWGAVLVAIGVRIVGGVPGARAYAVAAIVWIAGTIPVLAGPLLMTLRG